MKILFSTFLIIFLMNFSLIFAQNRYSAFGAPSIKYTSLNNKCAIILGGKFGFVINKSIVLGGGFYGLINNVHTSYIDAPSGQKIIMN